MPRNGIKTSLIPSRATNEWDLVEKAMHDEQQYTEQFDIWQNHTSNLDFSCVDPTALHMFLLICESTLYATLSMWHARKNLDFAIGID